MATLPPFLRLTSWTLISEIEARYGFPGLRPYLEERLEKGSVLFLLDGLDEAYVGRPHSSSSILHSSSAIYRHVVGQINVLAARYPHCPMVVTARRGSWKGFLAASFHTVEVLGFNRENIQRFIVNWFGTTDGENSTDGVRGLQGALSQNPRMWALAANPLLLSLMAFAFEQDGELPEGRAGLYGRGVELLLSTADGERFHMNGTDTEHKRSLLEEVALHFHLRRAFLFPEDELRGIITDYLPTLLSLPAWLGGQAPCLWRTLCSWRITIRVLSCVGRPKSGSTLPLGLSLSLRAPVLGGLDCLGRRLGRAGHRRLGHGERQHSVGRGVRHLLECLHVDVVEVVAARVVAAVVALGAGEETADGDAHVRERLVIGPAVKPCRRSVQLLRLVGAVRLRHAAAEPSAGDDAGLRQCARSGARVRRSYEST